MKIAGVVEDGLELDGLPRRDGAVFVLRRHHGRVEVHRVRGCHAHAGHRLVAAIRHREANLVADAGGDRWSRHLVAEGPAAEFHARRDLDDLWVVSRRTSFTRAGSSGFSAAVMDSALPAAKAPVCRAVMIRAGGDLKSIVAGSCGSDAAGGRASQAARASARSQSRRHVGRRCWMPEGVRPAHESPSSIDRKPSW